LAGEMKMNSFISGLTLLLLVLGATLAKDGLQRKGKLFSLFNTVTFKNEACPSTATTSNGNRNGTCYTNSECSNKKGSAQGSCAAGFGVCCVFQVTDSGDEISENCTYIQNPDFPATTTSTNSITYNVKKCSDNVCLLRLDFEDFSIRGVGGTDIANEGVCLDQFQVTATSNFKVPVICGENAGQHIYVDLGANGGDSAQISFSFTGNGNRKWDIKLTQVECGSPNNPPYGCLQYHTGHTGRIMTFNFAATTDNHLNNQQYSICIRGEENMCCVEYQVCEGIEDGFTISPKVTTAQIDSLCQSTDFVAISQSQPGPCRARQPQMHNRYCGKFFSPEITAKKVHSPVCDCTAPFIVDIFTNGAADIDAANPPADKQNTKHSRGVCLDYMQVPCTA